MEKRVIIVLSVLIIIVFFVMTLIVSLSPNFIANGELNTVQNIVLQKKESIVLGYCPTMKENAINFKSENELVELVEFDSAAQALNALKQNQINSVLIGRKAHLYELPNEYTQTTLISGYTLIKKDKSSIEQSQLGLIEIHTYLSKEIAESLLPKETNVVYYSDKNLVFNNFSDGKIALISWEDWQDNFELLVVMNGTEKAKEFRGAFLYQIK